MIPILLKEIYSAAQKDFDKKDMPIADKRGNLPRIIITGGAGFIGSALVSRLLREGYAVTVVDNLSTGKKESLIGSAKDDKLEFIELDLADSSTRTTNKLIQAVNQCDIIFHLAANADVRMGHINTDIDFSNNIIGTRNLLECIRRGISCRKTKKIIFTSSSTVYGDALTHPTSENYAPLKPISIYGASKLACEALISGYVGNFSGLTGVIFRLANIVGPTARRGVVFDMVKKLRYSKGKDLEILGDGRQSKSYLYIDDCIEALMYGLRQFSSPLELFNVASQDQISVYSVIEIIANELGIASPPLNYITSAQDGRRGWPGDVTNMLLSIDKLKALGWSARYSSKDAISVTVRKMIGRT